SINKLSVQLPSTQAGSVKPRGHVAPDSRLPEPRLSSHYYWHAVLFASSPRTGQRKVTHPHRRAEPSSEWNIRA
uniref:Uncharacterized protein n=1 Tax=Anopheles dirus TaxID=7168 RepID=A0A182NWA1_9DIPT